MRISTKDLVGEIERVFDASTPSKKFERDLEAEIERTRFRFRKQIQDWKDARKKMAEELDIPEDMIDGWKARHLFKSCTPERMEAFKMARKALYFRQHGSTENDIPDDPSQPLWDKKL